MSQENVERVRRAWEAWKRGDTEYGIFDSDVVYEDDLLPDNLGETYYGIEGVLKAWSIWADAWAHLETDIEWVRDASTDEVVSCHRARMRGKGSGVEGERRYAYVWRFRGPKVVYCKSFGDPREALEAVGLTE